MYEFHPKYNTVSVPLRTSQPNVRNMYASDSLSINLAAKGEHLVIALQQRESIW